MSVDATALLIGAPNQEEVAAAIRQAFHGTDVEVDTKDDDCFILRFVDPVCAPGPKDAKQRMMFVFPDYVHDYKNVYSGSRTVLSLGAFGGSVEIMNALAGRFGGFVRDYDNADWRQVEPTDGKGIDFPAEDRFRIAAVAAAGRKDGSVIASLVGDPEKFAAVYEAMTEYLAETAVPSAAP